MSLFWVWVVLVVMFFACGSGRSNNNGEQAANFAKHFKTAQEAQACAKTAPIGAWPCDK